MQKMHMLFTAFLSLCLLVLTANVHADVDQQVKQLTQQMNVIEQSVSQLEQKLLYPPVTRAKVFLSLSSGADFTLQTVSLRIDGHEKAFHIYDKDEINALRVGGIQSLWEGNVALGKRQITAQFVGKNRQGETVKGQAQASFEKTLQGHSLELQISAGSDATVFGVKDWGDK